MRRRKRWKKIGTQKTQTLTCEEKGGASHGLPCVPERSSGTHIGLGRGRQNERDLAMVKDPPIDLEEVVAGT
jgi:hypothetical protein